ncbi:hypothetical protein D3C73_1269740 [compost metagenome]
MPHPVFLHIDIEVPVWRYNVMGRIQGYSAFSKSSVKSGPAFIEAFAVIVIAYKTEAGVSMIYQFPG